MAGMTFAKMKDAMPAVKSLRYLLHTHLNGPESGRPLSRIHASALTKEEGFCPRFYALSDVTKTKPSHYGPTGSNVTAAKGQAVAKPQWPVSFAGGTLARDVVTLSKLATARGGGAGLGL